MAKNIKKDIQKQKDISYSNRDFESLRNDLKRFVSTYYKDVLVDTTDTSLAGMLIDVAAYVGDVTSYYLDHQFNENSLEKAVETRNIERLVREAGVKIQGKSPAIGFLDISIVIPSKLENGVYIPDRQKIPKIKAESIFTSRRGIKFYLTDDVDFAETNSAGDLIADFSINQTSNSIPVNFLLTRNVLVVSSKLKIQTVNIPDNFTPFRTISINDVDATEIVRVVDTDGEEYYEVESLTQSTIFKRIPNSRLDSNLADERIKLIHAPRRFITSRSSVSGQISLTFGSGNEDVFDEDIIPDPSEHAIKLYGDRKSLNKITIDPNSFLGTQTLGISPRNTTLSIYYRSGGGLNHNSGVGEVNSVTTLITEFPAGISTSESTLIRASASCNNQKVIIGGEDEPSIESLRQIALLNKNSQNRIVSREDLLARVYSLPNNFGRVFRAAVRDNPNNPQAAQLFILSRNSSGNLILSSDTLKENLSRYLSKFRIITDAIDILDGSIVNLGINYNITINRDAISSVVISEINNKIIQYFNIENFQIDQPVKIGEIENLIINTPDVESINNITFINKTGTIGNNIYSNYFFDPTRNIDRGYLFPPVGGLFEIKYPNNDIVGRIS
jgi:hypothetical protein